jgi:diguanylate cyclase (GGDEF)-like protein
VRVSDPLDLMDPLRELNPDLILLDMDLGPCTGRELAAALRQQDEFVGIPIVFLSSIDELERQIDARSVGAEDFLVKPVAPARLVAEVTLRAGRARSLRAHLLKDGQTGLLNAAALSVQLRLEVERARRYGSPLSFARIQIEGLHALGSAAGDGAADRVVRTLSRLLQHRLRRTDLAGRLGGDSFGLVLLDCDGEAAVRVLEGLASSFEGLRHELPGGLAKASLSAGVASFPGYPEAALLADAAEKALQRTQRESPGRILLAHA